MYRSLKVEQVSYCERMQFLGIGSDRGDRPIDPHLATAMRFISTNQWSLMFDGRAFYFTMVM